MAQIASPRGLRPSAAVLTVADLLSRNAPVPVKSQGDQSPPLSVGSLLRREGRAPHALDRPVKPRASRVDDDTSTADDDTILVPRTAPVTGRTVKGGAIAAGTLLAAGSVFGATVLTDTSGVGDQDSATGPYAGQGILDGTTDPGSTPTVTISPAAETGGLDAGAPAPSSWVPVAFPSALAGTSRGAPTAPKAPATRTPATRTPTAPASSSPAPGDTTNGTTSGGTTGSGGSTSGNGAGGTVTAVTGAAGSTVDNVGSAVPDPVGGTVSDLGDTVSGSGKALGHTVDTVTQPATSLVGGLVSGLLG